MTVQDTMVGAPNCASTQVVVIIVNAMLDTSCTLMKKHVFVSGGIKEGDKINANKMSLSVR